MQAANRAELQDVVSVRLDILKGSLLGSLPNGQSWANMDMGTLGHYLYGSVGPGRWLESKGTAASVGPTAPSLEPELWTERADSHKFSSDTHTK